MLRKPLGSAGVVVTGGGGGGGREVVVVGGGGGGGGWVGNWFLGGSSNRTNFEVSVVVAGSKVPKFENPLNGLDAWLGVGGGLGNPIGSLGWNSSSTSNSSSAASSSKISSGSSTGLE